METNQTLPKVTDFDFTFEAGRVDFIFEDLICEYYAVEGFIELYRNGIVEVYISKKAVSQMKKDGEKLTSSDLHSIMKTLKTQIGETLEDAKRWPNKENFSIEEIRTIFAHFGDICKSYSHFDYSYWDGAYERSKDEPAVGETVRLVQEFKNQFRADLETIFFKPDSPFSIVLQAISTQTGIPLEKLVWYRRVEIINLLKDGRVEDAEIKERRDGYVFYKNFGSNLLFFSGRHALKFMGNFFDNPQSVKTAIIKGRTAHTTGTVIKGEVRIIKRDYANPKVLAEAIRDMGEGEILVSATTDPESMGAIRKAAAIVTDVGGMLSHAAITSRELNIPCIVGTGNASKILKTGDLVEVDAEKGIVRILEKNHE